MFNSILIDKIIPLIEAGQCLANQENKELMIEGLMQIKHFYTLIRYESQKDYLIQFMEKMQLIKPEKGQIIYKQGQQTEGLYLVLKGSLSLWEQKTQGEINDEIALITRLEKFSKIKVPTDDMKKKIQQTQLQLDFFRKKRDDELFKGQKESYFLTENICTQKRVKYVNPGDSMNDDCVVSGSKTQYTAICQEDSQLLFINPHDYLKIFDLEINKLNFIVDVLKKNFASSKIDSLRRLSYKFKEEVFPYGSMIFHQNDSSHIFMIVKSGSVEISKLVYPGQEEEEIKKQSQKKIKDRKKKEIEEQKAAAENAEKLKKKKQKKSQYTQEEDDAYDEYQRYYGSNNNNREESDQEAEDEEFHHHRREEEQLEQKKKLKKSKKLQGQSVMSPVKYVRNAQQIKLGIIGSGEILGLEDYIQNHTRSFQAQSVAADTLIYYVNKKKIDDIIDLNEDQNLKKAMKQNGSVKSEWYIDQQSKIAKVNSVQELKSDEVVSATSVKKRFTEEEEVNFKSVVKKLFTDRRTKLMEDLMRREQNQSVQKLKDFPTLNSPQKIQSEQLYSQADSPIGRDLKNQYYPQTQQTPELSSGENTNNNLALQKYPNKDFQGQVQSAWNIRLNTHASDQNNFKQFNSQRKISQLEINFNEETQQQCSLSPDRDIGQDQQKIKKLSIDEEITKQKEYEQRFRTINDQSPTQKQNNKKNYTESQRRSLALPDIKQYEKGVFSEILPIQKTAKSGSLVQLDELTKQKTKKEIELLRNYQLETASLSLHQKIQYKLKNNILLSQKYKKYDVESSKGFQEAKKMVQVLRQSQQSKSVAQGNVLKQMREERQNNLSQILQNYKNDSQNVSSIHHILNDIDQPASSKRINLHSLSQIIEGSQQLIRLPPNVGSNVSFFEEDEKDKQANSVVFPAIIHSIQMNPPEMRSGNKTKQKEKSNNLLTQVQPLNLLEERINSMHHFSSPKNIILKQKPQQAFSSSNIQRNEESHSHITASHLQTEPCNQSEIKSKSNNKILDSFNDFHDNSSILQNGCVNKTHIQEKQSSIQLPQINNLSQILNPKSGLAPQISFSVKMSRKNIYQKYQDVYSQPQSGQISVTDRCIKFSHCPSESTLITINKLDVAEDVKERIIKRQQRLSQIASEDKLKSDSKIEKNRYSSVGKHHLLPDGALNKINSHSVRSVQDLHSSHLFGSNRKSLKF